MDIEKENLEEKKNSPVVQAEEMANKGGIVGQEGTIKKEEENIQKEGNNGGNFSTEEKQPRADGNAGVSKGGSKRARKISKKIVLIICLSLFVVAGIVVGVVVGLTSKDDAVVKMVEITGTSWLCTKNADDKDDVVRQINTGTVTLSSDEETQNKSVADIEGVLLDKGQFIKIVYDLKNVGPSKLSMRFYVQTNKRDNFNLYFMTDASDKKYEFNQDFSVDVKIGQTRQVVLYLEVANSTVPGECDIVINNSFLDLGGGK